MFAHASAACPVRPTDGYHRHANWMILLEANAPQCTQEVHQRKDHKRLFFFRV